MIVDAFSKSDDDYYDVFAAPPTRNFSRAQINEQKICLPCSELEILTVASVFIYQCSE
jgi:hypothetical protein